MQTVNVNVKNRSSQKKEEAQILPPPYKSHVKTRTLGLIHHSPKGRLLFVRHWGYEVRGWVMQPDIFLPWGGLQTSPEETRESERGEKHGGTSFVPSLTFLSPTCWFWPCWMHLHASPIREWWVTSTSWLFWTHCTVTAVIHDEEACVTSYLVPRQHFSPANIFNQRLLMSKVSVLTLVWGWCVPDLGVLDTGSQSAIQAELSL